MVTFEQTKILATNNTKEKRKQIKYVGNNNIPTYLFFVLFTSLFIMGGCLESNNEYYWIMLIPSVLSGVTIICRFYKRQIISLLKKILKHF